MLFLQERFADPSTYEKVKGAFVLTAKLLDEAVRETASDYNLLGEQIELELDECTLVFDL